MTKPKVFIASSVEGLTVAHAINVNIDHVTTSTVWPHGTFKLGSNALDDLLRKSSLVDFAIFAFTPDDVTEMRDETSNTVRDNVLFELGLFIGAIGKDRCYIVKPRDTEMRLPTDLLGVNTTDYESKRDDNDISSALNFACSAIKTEITRLGPIPYASTNSAIRKNIVANPSKLELKKLDLLVLSVCTRSHLGRPDGISLGTITHGLANVPSHQLHISVIKLLKLGYIEKNIAEDDRDGEHYFSYAITESGIEAYLDADEIINSIDKKIFFDESTPF